MINTLTQKEKRSAYMAAYYIAHREKYEAYRRDPGRRAAQKEYFKAYAIAHHEHRRAIGKAYRLANRERVLAHKRAYYLANKDKINEKRRGNLSSIYRDKRRDYQRRTTYGISKNEFDFMLHKQGGGCAICMRKDWSGRGPQIDHDHITGKVRGILCGKCNTAIGMIGDDLRIAWALVNYLNGKVSKED